MQKQDYFFTDNPRESVELSLDDGKVITGPRNGRLEAFAKVAQKEQEAMIVGVVLDGVLRELTYKLERDGKGSFITMADEDGARIYRRSLTFLLELAFKRCFANGLLTIDYSVSSGGYYCQVDNLPEFGPENLAQLEATMRQLVKEDLPFVRDTVPLEEAVAYFTECGEEDKVRLLKYRNRPDLVLYSLGEVRDYHHGYMVPSTGYLKWFALEWVGDAFIMHFPRRHKPNGLSPMTKYPKLLKAFQDYGEWLSKLGIPSVGALNDAIQMGHIDEV
ncbi:MAG TPA: nucleoside kinase, partial [Anaerolineaceae bacterium]|nr:nucleoside kinase [Anaerolineaceae bacterium]